jgi:uncharacterized membrane protein YvbJ
MADRFGGKEVPMPILDTCPDCGHKVSRGAFFCPACGHVFQAYHDEQKRQSRQLSDDIWGTGSGGCCSVVAVAVLVAAFLSAAACRFL